MAATTGESNRKGVWMRLLAWGIVASVAAFTVYVYIHNPFEGRVTFCSFHALTGLDCPGCGMTRAAYLILHGHPLAGLRQNPFILVVFVAAYMGLAELSPYLIGRQLPQLSIPNWVLIVLCCLLVLYTIARNVVKFF